MADEAACCTVPAAPSLDLRPVEGPDAEVELATLAKALGHPARVRILKVLAQRNACVCGELVLELDLAQSTVSQQLAIMRGEKLVAARREAQSVYYSLESEEVFAIIGTLQSLYAPNPEEFKKLKKAALTS